MELLTNEKKISYFARSFFNVVVSVRLFFNVMGRRPVCAIQRSPWRCCRKTNQENSRPRRGTPWHTINGTNVGVFFINYERYIQQKFR